MALNFSQVIPVSAHLPYRMPARDGQDSDLDAHLDFEARAALTGGTVCCARVANRA